MRGIPVKEGVVRTLRLNTGMTQEQVAARAELDVTTIRKMEKGGRVFDVKTILAVANALNCEFCTLIAPATAEWDRRQLHLDVVARWQYAFQIKDLETILSLHTEDTILQIPAADGLPTAGNFYGMKQLRAHMTQMFELFNMRSVRQDDFEIHAVDSLVFLRMTATFEYLPTGKSYESRHLNEFEFRDGLIARRSVIADYGQLRHAIE